MADSEVVVQGRIAVLKVTGVYRDEDLWKQHGPEITKLLQGGKVGGFAIDFQGVEMITSMAFGRLVGIHKQAASMGVPFALVRVPGMIHGAFRMMRARQIFKIRDSVEAFEREALPPVEAPDAPSPPAASPAAAPLPAAPPDAAPPPAEA
jgi:anti-anti-sigma factor